MRKTPEKSWKISADGALGALLTLMMLPVVVLLFLFGIADARAETPDYTMLALAVGSALYLVVAGWLDRLKDRLLGMAWVQRSDWRRRVAARLLDDLGFLLIMSVVIAVVSDGALRAVLSIAALWVAYAAVAAVTPHLARAMSKFGRRG